MLMQHGMAPATRDQPTIRWEGGDARVQERDGKTSPKQRRGQAASEAAKTHLRTRLNCIIRVMSPPTLQLLQLILQALSAFAIAAGVFYAATQFREARKAQAVANFAKLVELQYQLRKLRVEHPELASVHKHDVAHLHSDREIQEYFLSLMQLSLFEIAWYAHRQGQLPDDYFDSWAKRMKQLGEEDSFRHMLENPAMKIMHDDFDTYVRALLGMPSART
jgi:hypothetical protein